MLISRDNVVIQFRSQFFICCAISLLILPIKWILGFAVAVVAHELSHLIALRLLQVKIYAVEIVDTGINMRTGILTKKQEFLCAVAGPIGGFAFMFLMYRIPYISVCAWIQSVYNLLPVGNSDGARVFRILLSRFSNGIRVFQFCELTVFIIILVVLYFFALISANIWIWLIAILLVCRLCYQKYLAKRSNQ